MLIGLIYMKGLKMQDNTWLIKHTDTFGGDANYSWVQRYTFIDRQGKMTDRSIVRKAKQLCSLTGVRCDTYNYGGDYIIIKPRNIHQIVFVTLQGD